MAFKYKTKKRPSPMQLAVTSFAAGAAQGVAGASEQALKRETANKTSRDKAAQKWMSIGKSMYGEAKQEAYRVSVALTYNKMSEDDAFEIMAQYMSDESSFVKLEEPKEVERKTAKGVDNRLRYTDTGELVFTGIEAPEEAPEPIRTDIKREKGVKVTYNVYEDDTGKEYSLKVKTEEPKPEAPKQPGQLSKPQRYVDPSGNAVWVQFRDGNPYDYNDKGPIEAKDFVELSRLDVGELPDVAQAEADRLIDRLNDPYIGDEEIKDTQAQYEALMKKYSGGTITIQGLF
jgi:hypothetical protein